MKSNVKIKGRVSLIVFISIILLGKVYRFEINKSDYLFEIIIAFVIIFIICIVNMRSYLEQIFKGESF